MTIIELREQQKKLLEQCDPKYDEIDYICKNWEELAKKHSDAELEKKVNTLKQDIVALKQAANNCEIKIARLMKEEEIIKLHNQRGTDFSRTGATEVAGIATIGNINLLKSINSSTTFIKPEYKEDLNKYLK